MAARLIDKYKKEVVPALKERFGYTNTFAIPKMEKVVISMGIGTASADKAKLDAAFEHLTRIAGQRPVVTLAKMSVSNFKLREGSKVGLKVTLRGARMYEFIDRLVTLAIPRVRDFRGLNASSFDGRGNYNMGLVEQTVFPEIDPASITYTQGMNLAFQTTARTDEEARELLIQLGMPFKRD
jgi:large subunit ribosomal protein L5